MDIIKISLLGICGVILGFLLKGTGPEYAGFITMGIGIMILGLAVGKLEYLFQSVSQLKDMLPVSQEYFATLIKMIGVTYIGQFSAGICKDAGHQSTAAQIELFCKLSVMVLSMPVLMALLNMIQEFLT
nr:SpoIIIAC/SpoIIIAD family protein [uncultured Blautia sp.]